MKKLIIISFLVLLSCDSKPEKSQQSEYSIKAKIQGLNNNTKVLLVEIKEKSSKILDSTVVQNNSFEFKGVIYNPIKAQLIYWNSDLNNYQNIDFWLESADMKINTNINEFTNNQITGSELNNIQIAFNNATKEVYRKSGLKALHSEVYKFVSKNPNSMVSLSTIFNSRKNYSKNQIQTYYNLLDSNYKNSELGKSLNDYLVTTELKQGDLFRDIIANDLEGKIVKLSDYKGKVILLDFWASWCIPCRYSFYKDIKPLLEKYKNEDFVVVSYSLDTDYDRWANASKEDNVTWVNISNLNATNSKAILDYSISEVPRYFIIDRKGNIGNMNLSFESDENNIHKELNNLFSSN